MTKNIKYSHKHFSDYLSNETSSTIFLQPTDKEEIANIISSLNSNKASGPNSIPYRIQFARIHTSSLIKIEKILNRPITKFYNTDDVNVIAVELRLTKTRPTSLYKRHNLL